MKKVTSALLLVSSISLIGCFPFKRASVKGVHLQGWDYASLQKTYDLRQKALAYYKAGEYRMCIACDQQIFAMAKGKSKDYHQTAAAFARLNNTDSVFIYLQGYVKAKTANAITLAWQDGDAVSVKEDTVFNYLKGDVRWKRIVDTLNTCVQDFIAKTDKELSKELFAMAEEDQSVRKDDKKQSNADMKKIDSALQHKFDSIVSKNGVPGISMVGPEGILGVFGVIQHYGPAGLSKYLPTIQALAAKNEFPPDLLAYMEDRNNAFSDKPQVYGSQVLPHRFIPWAIIFKREKLYPVAEEQYVDFRRDEVGLPPLKDYLKEFNIKYKPKKLEAK